MGRKGGRRRGSAGREAGCARCWGARVWGRRLAWRGPGRKQAADNDGSRVRESWRGRRREMEGGPERPHSQVLHCSPLRLNTAPPENQ